jgi:hypothetical protein
VKVGAGHHLYQSGALGNITLGGMVVFHGGVMDLCQYYYVLLYHGDITAYYCDSIQFPGRPKRWWSLAK